jgi:hypothetical protein
MFRKQHFDLNAFDGKIRSRVLGIPINSCGATVATRSLTRAGSLAPHLVFLQLSTPPCVRPEKYGPFWSVSTRSPESVAWRRGVRKLELQPQIELSSPENTTLALHTLKILKLTRKSHPRTPLAWCGASVAQLVFLCLSTLSLMCQMLPLT